MRKKICTTLLAVMMAVSFTPADMASAVDFLVTVTIEPASGLVIQADKRDGQTEAIIEPNVSALNFDPMTLNTNTGVFESGHFFTVDARTADDGAGDPQVTVTYVDGAPPQGQTEGLGFKATAAFTKVTIVNNIENVADLNAHGKKLLKDISGELVTANELQGGSLRLFVGVFLGDDQDILNAGGSPFTAADRPGSYTGTLTLTGTVI